MTRQIEERNDAIAQYRGICEKQASKISEIEKQAQSRNRESSVRDDDIKTLKWAMEALQRSNSTLKSDNERLSKEKKINEDILNEIKYYLGFC